MKCNLVNENFRQNYAANLLAARGVKDIPTFLNPPVSFLQSPDNLDNIEAAAALYTSVVLKNEPPYSNVLIIVDADCDGFTSAAIIYQYTKRINSNCNVDYWLHDGKQHGLQDHIDRLMHENIHYDLLILPDSSSNDAQYHDMLKDIHLPCLILDHHLTDVALSDNAVVVNNQLSPNYTNKELTGAGVVYQFCRYLDKQLNHNWADDYIDLAACGIIGDMGSVLEPENRYLIVQGLKNINNSFFRCLLESSSYSITGNQYASWSEIISKTTPTTVAFYVVPMINALIRIGTMDNKELMFIAFIDGARQVPCNKRGAKGTLERADVEATRVCKNAKLHQNSIKTEAVAQLESKIFKYDLLENKVLFVRLDDEDDFPPELNGLIATQLAAKYKKPTIVARLNAEGYDRGSARGLNQSALKDFRQFLLDSKIFEYAQGHANAFGVSIADKQLDNFLAYANECFKDIDFGENCYDINFDRNGMYDNDINDLILDLGKMDDLWGQHNPQPLIHVTNIPLANVRIMGTHQNTVKIEYNGVSYMQFQATDLIQEIRGAGENAKLEIIGKPNLNYWNGQTLPQIFIEDYELHTDSIFSF